MEGKKVDGFLCDAYAWSMCHFISRMVIFLGRIESGAQEVTNMKMQPDPTPKLKGTSNEPLNLLQREAG